MPSRPAASTSAAICESIRATGVAACRSDPRRVSSTSRRPLDKIEEILSEVSDDRAPEGVEQAGESGRRQPRAADVDGVCHGGGRPTAATITAERIAQTVIVHSTRGSPKARALMSSGALGNRGRKSSHAATARSGAVRWSPSTAWASSQVAPRSLAWATNAPNSSEASLVRPSRRATSARPKPAHAAATGQDGFSATAS